MLVYTDRNTRIRFYSNGIRLLSWFREIETLEFDSAVMVLYYYNGLWRKKARI